MTEKIGGQITVNPLKYPSVVCDKCGHNVWTQAYVIQKIPGVVIGSGAADENYPIPVFVCAKCGEIMKEIRDNIEKGKKYQEDQKEASKGSSLIL